MTKIKRLGQVFYLVVVIAHVLATSILAAQDGQRQVLVADVEGPVTPIMLSFIKRAIAEADVQNVEALVLRLNTPGGSVDQTKEIIQAMIASDVPVVVYVWPSGGFAASAGTFITLAGHAAAMAPNTSIGAASPVSGGGGEIDETMRAKIENILVADIKGLADHRGEDAIEWATKTVTEAKAATAQEALDLGVIDFVSQDLDELLTQLDEFTVKVNGQDVTLKTDDARLGFIEQTSLENFFGTLADPSIALLLLSIGSLAIMYEIVNPGGYISGIIGAIFLLVGMYAIGQLPVNYAGLALILLAFGLFVAELFTPTFGLLTAAGVVSFILGGLIMFNTSEFAYQIPLASIVGIPLAMAAIVLLGLRKVVQSMKLQPTTGQEGLIGAIGMVKITLDPRGSVFVWGERWQASSENGERINAGEQVEVTEMNGFKLKVRKII